MEIKQTGCENMLKESGGYSAFFRKSIVTFDGACWSEKTSANTLDIQDKSALPGTAFVKGLLQLKIQTKKKSVTSPCCRSFSHLWSAVRLLRTKLLIMDSSILIIYSYFLIINASIFLFSFFSQIPENATMLFPKKHEYPSDEVNVFAEPVSILLSSLILQVYD